MLPVVGFLFVAFARPNRSPKDVNEPTDRPFFDSDSTISNFGFQERPFDRPPKRDSEDEDDDYGYDMRPTIGPDARNKPCPGPHTTRDEWGDCECEPDYLYGDPSSPEGCWGCPGGCHFEAVCVLPGKCQCNKLYKGDGSTCEPIIPQILAIVPDQGWNDETTLINISYVWDVEESHLRTAFCRIGFRREQVLRFDDNMIVCMARPAAPQAMDVAISFDGIRWSTEKLQFVFKKRFGVRAFFVMVWIYALIIAAVAACIWKGLSRRKKGVTEDEQPFFGRANGSKRPLKSSRRRRRQP
jgi:hypothetical protein